MTPSVLEPLPPPRPPIDLLDKCRAHASSADATRRPLGAEPIAADSPDAVRVVIDGREVLHFGSSAYFGLQRDPRCVEAAHRALLAYGTGTTGSRRTGGETALHAELERAVRGFMGRPHALLFPNVYQARLDVIGALGGPGDVIFLDSQCHPTLFDAARQSAAQLVRYRHDDPEDLDEKLSRFPRDARNKLVVFEALHVTRGEIARLGPLTEVTNTWNAYVVLDEAHSVGVIGPCGRGVAEASGVDARVDFVIGSLTTALGSEGGFCVSNHDALLGLASLARSLAWSPAAPPASVAAAIAAIGILEREGDSLRARLGSRVLRLRSGLASHGFDVDVGSPSPLICTPVGDLSRALLFRRELLARGVLANLILPPAAPATECLLRIAVTAAHEDRQIDAALHAVTEVGRALGVVEG